MSQVPPLTGDDLAYATLDFIREHPEEWDQAWYFCGTRACFAGRALLLSGKFTQIGNRNDDEEAARQLGWTRREASAVFYFYTRSFSALESRVKAVLNGEYRT